MNTSAFNSWENKAFVVDEVARRVLEEARERCARDSQVTLETLLNESAQTLNSDGDAGHEKALLDLAKAYAEEIHGGINPHLHRLTAWILPWFLKLRLRHVASGGLASLEKRLHVNQNILLTGSVEHVRRLAERGTLILVPNHVSNFDSIVIGLGLHHANLPPFYYGAGLNLFRNPLLAYLLNNLGAYKVDRKKKNTIYKDTLKQYATFSIENGCHNLFFPGGTRNRRGGMDDYLKLGLLGCGLSAFEANVCNGKSKPDVFVVPITLSYGLVLEAQSLIDEHLREEGKSRYIARRDDVSGVGRMLRFWKHLRSVHSKIHLHFCEPLDLFGNAVDAEGYSRDGHGRAIERVKYLEVQGTPTAVLQRDQEYTRELGVAILKSYRRNNVILPTHAVAFAAFRTLRKAYPQPDFYEFLRHFTGPDNAVSQKDILQCLGMLLHSLRELEEKNQLRLEDSLRQQDMQHVLDTALAQFKGYHDGQTLCGDGEKIWSDNLKLLYYYRNRLDLYALPD